MKYDVIIVGGGPAGCSAAIRLAQSGLSTLLLEEKWWQRDTTSKFWMVGTKDVRMISALGLSGREFKPLPGGAFEAEARMSLEDFEEQTGIALKTPDPEAEVDTLGGLAVALMGRLPKRGEIVTDPSGVTFEILEADPRRVRRVKIKPPAKIED